MRLRQGYAADEPAGAIVSQQPAASSIETPSGKGAGDENFPVGSILIAPRLRPHVARFYAFARAADDIADNPALSAAEKIDRLDAFEAGLGGAGPAKAVRLAESLAETRVTDRHARDLLAAFRQDARQTRYRYWDDLIGYCTLSANPVGRYLLDLHGEDPGGWPASDALCSVLQILNHIQDAASDLAAMDRVYVPENLLRAEGLTIDVLRSAQSPAGYRCVLDQLLEMETNPRRSLIPGQSDQFVACAMKSRVQGRPV